MGHRDRGHQAQADDSASWVRQIRRGFDQAVKERNRIGALGDAPFWTWGLILPEEVVREGARRIAADVRAGEQRHALEGTVLLLSLLRTRMRGARANRLWPEVAGELSRLSGTHVEAGICGLYFRRLLRSVYSTKLRSIEHHHRYVQLLLDEAGIGHDRARIVSEFFAHLVSDLGTMYVDEEPKDLAAAVLGRFLGARDDREDITALEITLSRAVTAVAQVAQALLEYEDPLETALWSWEDLSRFARFRAGVDLESVLPEAPDVFVTLIPHLGTVVSRGTLLQILTHRRYDIDAPIRPAELYALKRPGDVPLMTLTLRRGGQQRDVAVADELGMTAQNLGTYAPAKWHRIGANGLLWWDRRPFTVQTAGGGSERATAFYLPGRERREVDPDGFFWSGRLTPGPLPIVEGTGDRPVVQPRLRLLYRWVVEDRTLKLRLKGFTTAYCDVRESLRLLVGGGEVWQGTLDASAGFQKMRAELVVDPGRVHDPILAVLETGHAVPVAEHVIPVPCSEDAFLCVGGEVQKPGICLWDGKCPDSVALYVRDSTAFTIGPGSSQTPTSEHRLGRYREYRLAPSDAGELGVFAGGRSWRLFLGHRIGARIDGARTVERGGVEFRATGNCVLAVAASLSVTVTGQALARALGCFLEIRASGIKRRVGLDGNRIVSETGGGRLRAELPSALMSRLPPGHVEIRLVSEDGDLLQVLHAFALPGAVNPLAARIDDRPRVELEAAASPAIIAADDAYTVENWRSGRTAVGHVAFDDESGVTVSWRPFVRDLVLCGQDGQPLSGEGPIPLGSWRDARLVPIGADEHWRLELGETQLPVPHEEVDVAAMVAARGMEQPEVVRLALVERSRILRQWRLETAPYDVVPEDEHWTASDGLASLRVRLRWTGLSGFPPRIGLRSGGEWLAGPRSAPLTDGGGRAVDDHSVHVTLTVPSRQLSVTGRAEGALEVVALAGDQPLSVRRLKVPSQLLVEEAGREVEGRSLRRLLRDGVGDMSEEAWSTEILLVAEAAVRRDGRLPVPVDAACAGLARLDLEPETAALVSSGLRLLNAQAGGILPSGLASGEPPRRNTGAILLQTLHVIDELRRRKRGEAVPAVFEQLADWFAECAADSLPERVAAWARVLEDLCRDAGHAQAVEFRRTASRADWRAAADDPLVGFDGLLMQLVRNCANDEGR